ncbi:MAG: MSHA pilin protein MshB [Cognaticolwellia sp.]|jgi:MSHA pilin protein MshB
MNNRTQMNRSGIKQAAGFTLIELVIVVVILGFLAVTAIPKFLDLTEQAKQANIEGMAGGFATGVSLARAKWEAEARPNDGTNNLVDYDGTTVYLTLEVTADPSAIPVISSVRPGYILGTTPASTIAAVQCINVWNAILQQPPTTSASDLTVDSTVDYYVSTAAGICHYYLKASLERVVGDSTKYADPSNSTTVGNSFTYEPANSSVTVYTNNN